MKSKSKTENKIRLNFLVPGVLFGCVGAGYLSEVPNWVIGLPFQFGSLWAIWKAFPSCSDTYQPLIEKFTPLPKKAFLWPWAIVLVIAAWVFSFFCFENQWWIVGGVGVILLACGLYFNFKCFRNPLKPKEIISDKVVLIILLVLTVILRFPFLNQNFTGFQNDEATNLLGTMDLLQGKIENIFSESFRFTNSSYLLLAPSFMIFGAGLAPARGTAAVLSLLSVYFFYRWCRLYFGVAASGLATAFFSYSWWLLFDSLSPFLHISTVFFEIVSFYFWARALRDGRRLYFAIAGISMGACFWTYIAGRLILVILVCSFIGSCFIEGKRFYKSYWKHSLFTFLCFFWFLGPFLVSQAHHPQDFYGHVQELSILGTNQHDFALPLERIFTTFYTFFWPNPYCELASGLKNIPRLDPFLGLFCIFGIFLALFFIRRRINLVILFGLGFGIMAHALSRGYFSSPASFNGHRCTIVLPILFLFTAHGLDWTVGYIYAKPRPLRLAGFLLLAVLIGGSLTLNIRDYFFEFQNNPEAWGTLFSHTENAEVIESFYPKDHIVLEGHDFSGWFGCGCYDTQEEFLTVQKGILVNKKTPIDLPIKSQVSKDVVIFFADWDKYDAEEKKVREFYPRAIWKEYKNKYGNLYLTTVEITKEDVQELQKGVKLDVPLL